MSQWEAARRYGAEAGRFAGRLGRFVRYVLLRFWHDGCFAAAGALSYTTLVSLVPLLAISLAVLSGFPIFEKLRNDALDVIFNAFVPRIGGTVDRYVSGFIDSAGKTTAVGLVVLAVTATMLLVTIENRLNEIWRIQTPRRWVSRMVVYWTVLTLGPVLFGLALSVSHSLHGMGSDLMPGAAERFATIWLHGLAIFVPWLVESLALTLFYLLIPHCPVRWRDALMGAAAAATLIELGKAGFILYLDNFDSYQAIYGALAVVPIFLAWMYLTWSVVLFGAELAAAAELWECGEDFVEVREPDPLALAVAVLDSLAAQARQGGTARLQSIARQLRVPAATASRILDRLERAGFAAATREGGHVLVRDLERATMLELQQALETGGPRGQRQLDDRLAAIRLVEAETLAVPVARFLDRAEGRAAAGPALAGR